MTANRLSLQNQTDTDNITRHVVTFDHEGATLKGLLFTPTQSNQPLPGVVVTGAWTTVKEQMAGTYARELAKRGFAALAFDFKGWGESEGAPRFVENPQQKTADIKAAAHFLANHPVVDAERVFGLGICASSGYMAEAAADDGPLKKLALVAPWLHDPAMAEAIYGGPEQVATLISAGQQAAKTPSVMLAASATDSASLMFQAPYYTEPERGLIAAYDNAFNVASWEPWLTYDAQAIADRLSAPTLIVCSEAAALPAGAHAFVKRTPAAVEEHWPDDVNQFDFYDREDEINTAANAVAAHFGA